MESVEGKQRQTLSLLRLSLGPGARHSSVALNSYIGPDASQGLKWSQVESTPGSGHKQMSVFWRKAPPIWAHSIPTN